MLTVGDKFPAFNLKATVSTESVEKAFSPISNDTYKGKWLLVFFYPKDFTFVCPTEIKGFGDLNSQFADRDTQVLAASTDSEFVHLAWRKDHKDLRDLPFPMLADTAKRLSSALGILDEEEGVAKRATFLVDPEGDRDQAGGRALDRHRGAREDADDDAADDGREQAGDRPEAAGQRDAHAQRQGDEEHQETRQH